jgi:prepilin-type processing-associated H-X9-DG protein
MQNQTDARRNQIIIRGFKQVRLVAYSENITKDACLNGRWVYRSAMKPATLRSTCQAFTLIELLVIIVIVGVMIAAVRPAYHSRPRTHAAKCMSKLKQAGLGFLMYASDHADQLPWQVSTNSDVTAAMVASLPASDHFLVLSNYTVPPVTLVCPTDKARTAATNYSSFNNTNLSYFAGLSTTTIRGSNVWQLILAGDRHLSVDGQKVNVGILSLNQSSVPGWTKELHAADTTRGSLLFADGHVQFAHANGLPKLFKDQSLSTTRLVIP